VKEKSVLIVDDDLHILIAVSTILNDAGINVLTAESGDECLKIIEAGFYGVVLMDIMMPEKDGWDTIREIIRTGKENGVVIVMLTAKDTPDEKMEGLQEYVLDYITKPFEADEFVRRVSRYLKYIHD